MTVESSNSKWRKPATTLHVNENYNCSESPRRRRVCPLFYFFFLLFVAFYFCFFFIICFPPFLLCSCRSVLWCLQRNWKCIFNDSLHVKISRIVHQLIKSGHECAWGSLSPKEESAARDPQVKSTRWHQRGRKLEANKDQVWNKEKKRGKIIITMGILEYYDTTALWCSIIVNFIHIEQISELNFYFNKGTFWKRTNSHPAAQSGCGVTWLLFKMKFNMTKYCRTLEAVIGRSAQEIQIRI